MSTVIIADTDAAVHRDLCTETDLVTSGAHPAFLTGRTARHGIAVVTETSVVAVIWTVWQLASDALPALVTQAVAKQFSWLLKAGSTSRAVGVKVSRTTGFLAEFSTRPVEATVAGAVSAVTDARAETFAVESGIARITRTVVVHNGAV